MEPTRYRSTRHRRKSPYSEAGDVNFSAASTPSLTSTTPPANVTRSPSRYRRRRGATASSSTSDLNTHPVPDIPSELKASQASVMPLLRQQPRENRPHGHGRIAETAQQRPRTGSERSLSGDKSRTIIASRTWPQQYEANGSEITHYMSDDRGVKEGLVSASPTERTGFAKRFGRLRKRGKDETVLSWQRSNMEEQARTVSSESKSSEGEAYSFIKAGGGGAVPGTDAPKSAVNAGNRYVMVECGRASVNLPVTPSTTVSDLIKTASNYLSESIDPRSSVLLESFSRVGVQRPLRKYERVRDIMNSWDNDTQNELVLVESATGGKDRDLYADGVPSQKPDGYSNWLYYSQKVGKWDKRWITIREDGQVTISKSSHSADAINLCHLSDFDIYSPMPRQISRKIRPPKKICFAIKSQQKLAFFASSEDFVQFFCTSDRDVATEFYTTAQRWRSWYLVNVLGEGERESRPAISPRKDAGGRSWSDSSSQLGRPRADYLPRRNSMTQDHKGLDSRTMYNRMMSVRAKAPPPVSFPGYVPQQRDAPSSRKPGPSTSPSDPVDASLDPAFAPSGLLGRQYSVKQKSLREQEARESALQAQASREQQIRTEQEQRQQRQQHTQVPVSDDDSSIPRRSNSVRSHTGHRPASAGSGGNSDLGRNRSVKQNVSKPLVDLTPQQHKPPQYQRKGHGFVPDRVGPGGLIECATSPENAIGIPPSTDWRARNNIAANSDDDGSNIPIGNSHGYTSTTGLLANTHSQADPKSKPPLSAAAVHAPIVQSENSSPPATANTPTPPLKSARRSNSVRVAHDRNATQKISSHSNSIRHPHAHPSLPSAVVSGDLNGTPPPPPPTATNNIAAMNSAALFNSKVDFVQSSLLAASVPGQGDAETGKGIMTGAHATGPMLDLSRESEFAPGSLLARVEKGGVVEGRVLCDGVSGTAGVMDVEMGRRVPRGKNWS